MQCVQLTASGLENLEVVSGAAPEPGPGEVRVRMQAAAINYRDFMICAGIYGGGKEYPLIPLSDGAGVVESVGSEVMEFEPGDRVMTVFWQDWESQPVRPGVRTRTTGCEAPGALTELGVFPESALLAVPDENDHGNGGIAGLRGRYGMDRAALRRPGGAGLQGADAGHRRGFHLCPADRKGLRCDRGHHLFKRREAGAGQGIGRG